MIYIIRCIKIRCVLKFVLMQLKEKVQFIHSIRTKRDSFYDSEFGKVSIDVAPSVEMTCVSGTVVVVGDNTSFVLNS